MKKKVPVVTVAEPEEVAQLAGLPLEATVALADLATAVKDGLLAMCADVGLMVMAQVMEDELTRRIGPKHAKLIDRTANWHGTTTGSVSSAISLMLKPWRFIAMTSMNSSWVIIAVVPPVGLVQ